MERTLKIYRASAGSGKTYTAIALAVRALKNKEIKKFDKENIFVLNGRFGPYISYNKKNFKIPKNLLPEELTLEDCQKIINGEPKTKKTRKTICKKTL